MGRESINKIIGRNVRAYRIAGGMTQKDLAEAMNCSISQQHINRIEKGTLSLVPIKAFYVADALDISMKDIYAIGGESDDLFSDNNVVVILEAYKSLPDDKQKVAISEVMKCVSDQLKGDEQWLSAAIVFDWYEFACDWALIVVLLVITVKSCTHLYLIRETIHESKVEQLAE